MKVKQKEAIKAYKVFQKLNNQETSGAIALRIFKAMNALQSAWDFQLQEERKIFERHPNFDPSTGSISLKDKEIEEQEAVDELKAIDNELSEIANIDTDVDFEPFTISLDFESLKLSGQDIKNLSGFVDFE